MQREIEEGLGGRRRRGRRVRALEGAIVDLWVCWGIVNGFTAVVELVNVRL